MAAASRPPAPSPLDRQIDDLYRLPLSEFTAARNALGKGLPAADAARVKKLAKPNAIAWAVNQVWWNARSIYDQLLQSGETLREAEIAAIEKTGKPRKPTVREATEAHKKAVADAVHQALRLSGQAGGHPQADALTRMFEAISLAPGDAHPHGRLVEAVQPAGFEALFGVTPADRTEPPRPVPAPREERAAGKTKPGADAKAAEAIRRQAVASAEAALTRARTEEQEARAQVDQRAAEIALAEQSLERARQAHDKAVAFLRQTEKHRATAEAAAHSVSPKGPRR